MQTMKTREFATLAALICVLLPGVVRSQDNVTIPKSRLEELERKEKELEKLKKPATEAKPNQAEPPRTVSNAPVAVPVIQPKAPAVADWPPFKEGDTIEARDLAAYYFQDASAADRRFKKQKLQVRGEIAGFEKPLFQRNYRIRLRTGDRDSGVKCDLVPPENFNAVFPADDGSELVGLMGETRVPLAKVGEVVEIRGVCKGLHKKAVLVVGSRFNKVR